MMKHTIFHSTKLSSRHVWLAIYIAFNLAFFGVMGALLVYLYTEPDEAAPVLAPFALGYLLALAFESMSKLLKKKAIDAIVKDFESIWHHRLK